MAGHRQPRERGRRGNDGGLDRRCLPNAEEEQMAVGSVTDARRELREVISMACPVRDVPQSASNRHLADFNSARPPLRSPAFQSVSLSASISSCADDTTLRFKAAAVAGPTMPS